jgi:hypothetical protein
VAILIGLVIALKNWMIYSIAAPSYSAYAFEAILISELPLLLRANFTSAIIGLNICDTIYSV